jgi:hypothetical protein
MRKEGNDMERVKKGGADINESFGWGGAADGRGETDPAVIGSSAKDCETGGVSVRMGEGDTAKPRFLDGENVGIGGLEEGVRHVVASAHVD